MPFADYLRRAVLEPLGTQATLEGSPAWGLVGSLADALALAAELLAPRVVAAETLAEATEVAFPDASSPTTGASASSSATASGRTGRANRTPRERSAISGPQGRSCGWTPKRTSRAYA